MTDSQNKPSLRVTLPGGSTYPIYIGDGILAAAGMTLAPFARGGRVVVISQPPIARRYAPALQDALRAADLDVSLIVFANGESRKTLATVARLYQALYNLRADRKTLIVALGGGVVGDVAGFVAASYLRGLDYVQVPTTLLAMVDSSVGGKTGVDFADGKNLVGAFHQPRAVLADTGTLNTLSSRDVLSGMAEVIKYGIIRDPSLLAYVRSEAANLRRCAPQPLAQVIARSCTIKADVVAGDEREETGLRAILNYGHTVGHALEAVTRYRRFRHGEAISIGMVAAAAIGEVAGVTPTTVRETVAETLREQGLPIAVPDDIPATSLTGLLSLDKKAERGKVHFVLARALGAVELRGDIDESLVRAGLALQTRLYSAISPVSEVREDR